MEIPKLITLKRQFFDWLPENNRLERIWKLAQIDFNSRYYNQRLGLLWALIKPLTELGIYYFIFSILFETDMKYFGFYIFLGLILWSFFTEGTIKGLQVLYKKKYLIEAIQFNKFDLFLSSTFSAFFAFLFNLSVFIVIALFFGIDIINKNILFIPILIINLFILTISLSLLLATLRIFVNDIINMWDMIVLGGFWATPIVYDYKITVENASWLIYVNPISGIIINFREIVLYNQAMDYQLFIFNLICSSLLLLIAILIFSKFSHKAAEKL